MILKWLAHYDGHKGASNVLTNLLGVAMLISVASLTKQAPAMEGDGAMIPGDLGRGIILQSPFLAKVAKALPSASLLTQKELDYVQKFEVRHANRDESKDLTPLQLALLVSPLYLFIPSVLMKKKRMGKQTLVEVSIYKQDVVVVNDNVFERPFVPWEIASPPPLHQLRR
jgi:hypothetical protein